MSRRPNIILILIDDMGWRDLSCYGSSFYETPNIDRLCAGGMRFTDAYAACPVCSPTRASLLTGKYPATVGITDWIDWHGHIHPARGAVIDVPYLKQLPTSEKTVAAALRDGGYQTWHVGKWHLGGEDHLPQDHGFDVNIGGCHMGSPGRGGYFSPWTIDPLVDADVPDETYLTDYLTDGVVDLINGAGEQPFFLNLCYYCVHTPIQAKPERISRYEQKARDLGLDQLETFREDEYYPMDHKKDQRVRRRLLQSDPVYAAMIDSLDENIGRILDALDESGVNDDTLILFTSDNGGLATSEGSPTCNAPLAEGKGWMYEGGTREPWFVRWPAQIEAGSQCQTPVTSPDVYPTLLEAAGLEPLPQQHVDGESILPLLLQQQGDLERSSIFWHYPHYGNQGGTPGSSVRSGDWKLIEFYDDGRLELYNLRDDIGEETNRVDDEPDLVADLHRQLKAWRESVTAKIPARNPDWEPPPIVSKEAAS